MALPTRQNVKLRGFPFYPVAALVQRQAVQRWDISELGRAYKLVEEH
jgi:hypothetical protein